MVTRWRNRCATTSEFPPRRFRDLLQELRTKGTGPISALETEDRDGTRNVNALIAADPSGTPHVIGPRLGHWADRFRLARSAFFLYREMGQTPPRLVTRAFGWDQRASRAFAAELLAPSAALRDKVGAFVAPDEIDELARIFDVRPTVIEHQLLNHKLASIEPS